MCDYLDSIQPGCDSLASCGRHVDDVMQISTIIVGLPMEYEHVVTVISVCRPPPELQTVCCILLDAEARQQNMLFSLLSVNLAYQPISPSLDHALQASAPTGLIYYQTALTASSSTSCQPLGPFPTSTPSVVVSSSYNFGPHPQYNSSGRPPYNPSFGRGRCRSNNAFRPQCQLCDKFGHIVHRCYFRFDPSFARI